MWKRVWGALDSLLSCVGFATLVLVGLRYWRGLPVVPPNLMSAPSAVSVAASEAAPGQPPGQAPGQAPAQAAPQATLMPIVPLADNAASTKAPWREDTGGSSAPASSPAQRPVAGPTAAPALKQAHNWAREISVTVNASRYVKSLADLAPPPASLPEAARRELKAAQELTKGSEMLLVCNVTVEYSGGEEVTLDQGGFKLVSPERQLFPSVSVPFSTRDLQPLRATLLANGSAKGDLVFPVKRGVQPDEILYNPS